MLHQEKIDSQVTVKTKEYTAIIIFQLRLDDTDIAPVCMLAVFIGKSAQGKESFYSLLKIDDMTEETQTEVEWKIR